MVRVLFFGKLADAAGERSRDMVLGNQIDTVEGLRRSISNEDDHLGTALNEKSVRCIVNEIMVPMDSVVSDGDEVAFIPPVSGG